MTRELILKKFGTEIKEQKLVVEVLVRHYDQLTKGNFTEAGALEEIKRCIDNKVYVFLLKMHGGKRKVEKHLASQGE